MTSSGRRVKRRNLDECDDNALRNNRSKKGKSGRKKSRRRSSKSKSSRPQRAAARNALHLFSKITGTPTDGEEDSFDGDFSESESSLQESNIESDESGRHLQNDQQKYSKGKEISLDESEDTKSHELPEPCTNAVNRRRLVLRLPVRDSKPVLETSVQKFDNQAELVATSSKSAQQATNVNRNGSSSKDPLSYSGSVNHDTVERDQANLDYLEDPIDLFDGYMKGKIRWGVVRARTSRCLKVGEAVSSDANARSVICLNDVNEKENFGNGHEKEDKDFGTLSPLEIQKDEEKVDSLTEVNENCVSTTSEPCNASENGNRLPASNDYRDEDESLTSRMNAQDTTTASIIHSTGADQHSEPYIGFPYVSTKVRSKRSSRDPESESPAKNETKLSLLKSSSCGTHVNDLNKEQKMVVAADDNTRAKPNQGENGAQKLYAQVDKNVTSHDSLEPNSRRDKMYKAVYRRSRSNRAVTNIGDGGDLGESTSNGSNINLNAAVDLVNGTNEAAPTTGSLEMEPTTSDPNSGWSNVKVHQGLEYCTIRSPLNGPSNRGQPTEEERGSSSKMAVGLRSTRSRRANYHYIHEASPINRKKTFQSATKGSWLLLSIHEEGCRYIPQQGDEVVYLRQVCHKISYLLLTIVCF